MMIRMGESVFDLVSRTPGILKNSTEGIADTFEIFEKNESHEIFFSFLNKNKEETIRLGVSWFFILRGSAANVTSLTFSHQSASLRWQDFLSLSKDSIAAMNSSGLRRMPLVGSHSMPVEEIELMMTANRPMPVAGDKIAMAAWLTPQGERVVLYARLASESWHLETLVCLDYEKELRLRDRERQVREYFGCDPDNLMHLDGRIEPKRYVAAFDALDK